jgi:hypothetical protein
MERFNFEELSDVESEIDVEGGEASSIVSVG